MNNKLRVVGALSLMIAQPVFALSTGDVLAIAPGSLAGSAVAGSWFGFDANGSQVIDLNETYLMSPGPDGGVVMGVTQIALGSHYGSPDGTESPRIDAPTEFYGTTGMHGNSTPVTILSDLGTTKLLDFSGWHYIFNGIEPTTPSVGIWLGSNYSDPASSGIATLVCGTVACSNGDTFTLDYAARVPLGEPTCCGGLYYELHIEGVIQGAVPVPAAAWLFGSGMLALLSAAGRRRLG